MTYLRQCIWEVRWSFVPLLIWLAYVGHFDEKPYNSICGIGIVAGVAAFFMIRGHLASGLMNTLPYHSRAWGNTCFLMISLLGQAIVWPLGIGIFFLIAPDPSPWDWVDAAHAVAFSVIFPSLLFLLLVLPRAAIKDSSAGDMALTLVIVLCLSSLERLLDWSRRSDILIVLCWIPLAAWWLARQVLRSRRSGGGILMRALVGRLYCPVESPLCPPRRAALRGGSLALVSAAIWAPFYFRSLPLPNDPHLTDYQTDHAFGMLFLGWLLASLLGWILSMQGMSLWRVYRMIPLTRTQLTQRLLTMFGAFALGWALVNALIILPILSWALAGWIVYFSFALLLAHAFFCCVAFSGSIMGGLALIAATVFFTATIMLATSGNEEFGYPLTRGLLLLLGAPVAVGWLKMAIQYDALFRTLYNAPEILREP